MNSLEVFVNEPFDGELLRDLFQSEQDLKLANPKASFPYDPKEWQDLITVNSDNCSLLFRVDGKIIGQTSLLLKEEKLFLCFVILHPNHRKSGLSSEMILKTEEFCRLNYNHLELYLNVREHNTPALKLYQKLGYELVVEVEKGWYQMKKSLVRP